MKILLTEKSWHDRLYEKLKTSYGENSWLRISDKKNLNDNFLRKFKIDKIFIPHWSDYIDKNIYEKYECILFHMTDLPFGRGGSPLQNLIIDGFKSTKISAIKVGEGIDDGPIYLKKELSLSGSAREIFNRSSSIIETMINEIIQNEMTPTKQIGEPTYYKRRKPSQSKINGIKKINDLYNHIRMLDCDGYPRAYIEFDGVKIEFENAKLIDNEIVNANVRIFKK